MHLYFDLYVNLQKIIKFFTEQMKRKQKMKSKYGEAAVSNYLEVIFSGYSTNVGDFEKIAKISCC